MKFDFPTILVLLVAISGFITLVDKLFFAKARRALNPEPAPNRLVEYARSFFPVFLIVLLLRSFLVEPFRIPSGSMMPTLVEGDFILVNKFTYGIRLPVSDTKFIDVSAPERGDVVVFRAPATTEGTPYIKRVIGLPGDKIDYREGSVFVNDKKIEQLPQGTYVGEDAARQYTGTLKFEELLPGASHEILREERGLNFRRTSWTVPAEHYFVMGDNRDNSSDSRVWGFVPDENLIGKAFVIWLNYDVGYWPRISRIGTIIR